jgi:uncharacterized protein
MLIREIEKLVEEECRKPANHYGYEAWKHHILQVVKNAKLMARKTGADIEIVEIAALLHDLAGIKDISLEEDHHIHGANLAEQILRGYNYPTDKIEQVKHCIESHRGRRRYDGLSLEAQCLADGDAMAHFYEVTSLICMAYSKHNMTIEEVDKWLVGKLGRSWSKASPKARELIKDRHQAVKLLFD